MLTIEMFLHIIKSFAPKLTQNRGTDNLIASQVKLLAAALDETRDVGESLIIHDDCNF